MQDIRYNAGDVIVQEGEPGSDMYVIKEGQATVYSGYGTWEEKKLAVLEKGKIFGEMSLLEYYPRSATVEATGDGVAVTRISREEFDDFLLNDPEQVFTIMENLSSRLRDLTEEYSGARRTLSGLKASLGMPQKRDAGLMARAKRYIAFSRNNPYQTTDLSLEQAAQLSAISPQVDIIDPSAQIEGSKGQILFREGETGSCMYHVVSGAVGIFSGYLSADEKMLVRLEEDQFFGEMGMIENKPRSADAVFLKNGSCVRKIERYDIEVYCRTNPEMVKKILRHLSSRLRSLTIDYLEVCRAIADLEAAAAKNRGYEEEAGYRAGEDDFLEIWEEAGRFWY